jgi:phosphoribosylpyrophosphate synthetase
LAGQALDRLHKSSIDELVTTDTLSIKDPQRYPNLTVLYGINIARRSDSAHS